MLNVLVGNEKYEKTIMMKFSASYEVDLQKSQVILSAPKEKRKDSKGVERDLIMMAKEKYEEYL